LTAGLHEVLDQAKRLKLVLIEIKAIHVCFLNVLPIIIYLFLGQVLYVGLLAKLFYLEISRCLAVLLVVPVDLDDFHDLPNGLAVSDLSRFLHD
jgi:hypothetical protein